MHSNNKSAELAGLHDDVTAVIRYLLSLTDGIPGGGECPGLDEAEAHAQNIQEFLDSFQLVVTEYRAFQQLTRALGVSDPRFTINGIADNQPVSPSSDCSQQEKSKTPQSDDNDESDAEAIMAALIGKGAHTPEPRQASIVIASRAMREEPTTQADVIEERDQVNQPETDSRKAKKVVKIAKRRPSMVPIETAKKPKPFM
ncbi:hypothetical protein LIPSTDRAFT_7450 [Lipomyces starkeyi NRRL Y-11557]|uniref:Uncharacterized protein n=1 Tax=Lipomyces starkeyi NRRL Y-11557 TaxID=675824 RepID=A0A1E3PTM4_LIPST|nr:hypothetical protein LIPSTDRAFT_7450 [Lipomyces starkeyi NRRL Y-11557]